MAGVASCPELGWGARETEPWARRLTVADAWGAGYGLMALARLPPQRPCFFIR